ncbi:MAG: response regulator [Flavobacteriaceae bacterium]|nr:response regulator [Flavobacteriaceae bacterium]
MSRIKFYIIFVFVCCPLFVVFSANIYQDEILSKTEIDEAIQNCDVEYKMGNYYLTINEFNKLLKRVNEFKDKESAGIIHSKLAQTYYKVNEIDSATASINRALKIQIQLDNRVNLAKTRYTYGLIFLHEKKFINALEHFKFSKRIFQEEELHKYTTKVTLHEADVYLNLKEYDKANNAIDEALILAKKNDCPRAESIALIKSGSVALAQHNFDKALSQVNKGKSLAYDIDFLEIIERAYFVLSEIYSHQQDYELAIQSLHQHIRIKDSIIALKRETLVPEKKAQLIIDEKSFLNQKLVEKLDEKKENESLTELSTFLSVVLIIILSLLTLSLYKNNNIRLKTNNMLYKKNEELLTEKERAEIASKTKSNFLSTVTHELRTPLYAVTGLTNMLLEEDPKPEQIQHLKSLKFSGDYLLTFINDILQINKIEANKEELDKEVFSLKNKVENVIAALSNSASNNNIKMHLEYDKNLPETFHGDQLKISQILINLIGNSIKFTKDGDIWVRVTKINQKRRNYTVRLEVEDNGIGITKEKQDNMFESFSQGSVQINRKYGGTGLGLSIVKGIVDILKGKIFMQSELGRGTSFFIEIPLEEPVSKVVTSEELDSSSKIKELDLDEIKILLVEDNKINQMITKKILTKMGLSCDLTSTGEDAVEKVREFDYNVVLMDIHMPGISGLEATKQIRQFNKDITIFALTAVTIEDKMSEFVEAGFSDIISKPFKQDYFEKKLYSALSGNHKPRLY